ncbi:MAG: hypothetical protein M3P45_14885 [Acidobacteriota bacterium]|nr:hypothetical protein [Acidobacteriota bacterium]
MKREFILVLIAGIGISCGITAHSLANQNSSAQTAAERTPAVRASESPSPADPKDVGTADALIAALYDVISGPAGKPRNWERMYSLFFPGALLIRAAPGKSGQLEATVMSPKDYVDRAGKYFETHPFFERESSRTTHSRGDLEQIFSMYESSEDAAFAKPFAHGVNNIELFHDGKRWWIMMVMWEEDPPEGQKPN